MTSYCFPILLLLYCRLYTLLFLFSHHPISYMLTLEIVNELCDRCSWLLVLGSQQVVRKSMYCVNQRTPQYFELSVNFNQAWLAGVVQCGRWNLYNLAYANLEYSFYVRNSGPFNATIKTLEISTNFTQTCHLHALEIITIKFQS